jgi:hypothetical protein
MSRDEIPGVVAGFVDIHKATGLSVESLTEMHDQLQTIGGFQGEEFTDMMGKMKMLADEGRVSMEALAGAVQGSAAELRVLSEEARKAYAENVLTTVSGLEEMGLAGAQNFEELKDAVYGTVEGYVQAMAAMQRQGLTPEQAEKAYRSRNYDVVMGSFLTDMQERMGQMLPAGAEGGALTPIEKEGFRAAFQGLPVSDEMFAAIRDMPATIERLGLAEGSTVMDVMQAMSGRAEEMAEGVTGAPAEDYLEAVTKLHRDTIAEQREQGQVLVEEMRVQFATVMAPAVQDMAMEAKNLAAEGVHKLLKWDEQYDNFFSKAIGFYSLATPLVTALRGVLSMIPGMGGLSEMMGGGLGGAVSTALGALGLNKLFGGGGAEGITLGTGATLAGGEALAIQEAIKGFLPEGVERITPMEMEAIQRATGYGAEDIRKILKADLGEQKKSGFSIIEAFKGRMERDIKGAKMMVGAVIPGMEFSKDVLSQYAGYKAETGPRAMMGTAEMVIPGVTQAPELLAEHVRGTIETQGQAAKLMAIEAIGGPGEVARQMSTMHQERVAQLQEEMLLAQQQTQEVLARGTETTAESVKIQQEHKDKAIENMQAMVERLVEIRDELRKKGQVGFRPVSIPGTQSEEDFLVQEAGR